MVRHAEDAELLGATTDANEWFDDAVRPHAGKESSPSFASNRRHFHPLAHISVMRSADVTGLRSDP